MREQRTLERLRDEYDTTKLLVAVDELDHIRNVVADGDNLEPPEVRDQLLKLHGITMAVVNEGHPLSTDGEEGLLELAWEIESVVGEINDAADKILEAVGELIRLCPDEEDLEDEEDEI